MGLAYGEPFYMPGRRRLACDAVGVEAAAEKLRARAGHVEDSLWRVEAVRYATVDYDERGDGEWYATDARLELFAFPVDRRTPCGAWILYGWSRWVDLRPDRKQWASATPAEALAQFVRRRQAQIRILRGQLSRAEHELALTEPLPTREAPVP